MPRILVIAATAGATIMALQLAGAQPPADSISLAAAQPAAKPAANSSPSKARYGAWGIDLSFRDTQVKPGDDFYRYAGGHWLATNKIPADRSRWSTFDKLDSEAEEQVRGLLQTLSATAAAGSIERKVGDYYRTYLDTQAIERAGIAPARAGLDAIAAARTHADIARLMGRPDLNLSSPIGLGVTTDEKNPDRYIVRVGQSGLGLPDREYYLKQDEKFKKLRVQYQEHIERMLVLAGHKDGLAQAKTILDVETKIATVHWPVAKRRERELTYNLRTRKTLEDLAPAYPWAETLAAASLDKQKDFVVAELDAVQALGKLFPQVPVAAWRSYLTFHYLGAVSDVLPKAFDDEHFGFYGRTLNGQEQQRDRWKRGVDASDRALGEAIGQLYVKKYFSPQSKAKMLELVENLRIAYGERIRSVPWMTEATKKVALEKLATFRPKIGYPDKWRDYSSLEVKAGDVFGNRTRATLFSWKLDLERLSKPADRGEWFMTPQTVNAYYNPDFNEIVFPAAILQPPFFDLNADPAVNYGAIGAVIGHEMGHGFDDQGAKSDAKGILRTWWNKQDEAAFKKLGDKLVAQYDGYEALPGLKLNGRLTLGENIGDLGGMTVAHAAYRLSLKGKAAPVLDGVTGEQRFFLSWAQVWFTLNREESLRNQVMTNPHSPAEFRVNGVVRNIDAWYSAFDIKPGNKMYLAPEQRVHIW